MKKEKFLLLTLIFIMCVGTATACDSKSHQNEEKASNGVTGAASEVLND